MYARARLLYRSEAKTREGQHVRSTREDSGGILPVNIYTRRTGWYRPSSICTEKTSLLHLLFNFSPNLPSDPRTSLPSYGWK